MKKALLVGETASLARDLSVGRINMDVSIHSEKFLIDQGGPDEREKSDEAAEKEPFSAPELDNCDSFGSQVQSIRSFLKDASTGLKMGPQVEIPRSLNARIDEILGSWEELEFEKSKEVSDAFDCEHPNSLEAHPTDNFLQEMAGLGEIIQFRQSLSYLNTNYPFTAVFGSTTSRQECVECSESLYNRLLLLSNSPGDLKFDVLALLAIKTDGSLNEEKLKALVKLFRPDREGNLTLVDFAKSIDACYKEIRLLKAGVAASTRVSSEFNNRMICVAISQAHLDSYRWIVLSRPYSMFSFILSLAV